MQLGDKIRMKNITYRRTNRLNNPPSKYKINSLSDNAKKMLDLIHSSPENNTTAIQK